LAELSYNWRYARASSEAAIRRMDGDFRKQDAYYHAWLHTPEGIAASKQADALVAADEAKEEAKKRKRELGRERVQKYREKRRKRG